MVQLGYDEELEQLHGMYGSMESEFEVQRTVERADQTAFLCLQESDWTHQATTQELLMGCGEEKINILSIRKFWEELHRLVARDIVVEVEHVKAHRTKKDKKDMTHLEKFVTEGNEKADDLAEAGAMLDEGFMAEVITRTVQEREEVHEALQYAASFHCLVELWQDCAELKPKPIKNWNFVDRVRTRSIFRSGVYRPSNIVA